MLSGFYLDFAVIAVYLLAVIGIGLYMGRKEEGLGDFALGGRNIPWWAVLASILAAEISAGTFLGTPEEGYGLRNFTYAQLAIGTVLARIVVAYLFIGRFYQMRVVSIYEFLEQRFGKSTKLASSALFIVTRSLASGSRMFVPAILLVAGWEMIKDVHPNRSEALLLYVGAVGFLTLITAVYTTFGGIKAVVWTDLLQVTLMFGAMTYAMVTLWHSVGGWETVVRETGRVVVDPAAGDSLALAQAQHVAANALRFWDWGITPGLGFWGNVKKVLETEYTVFSALLASIFVTMATHGTDQDMVQRMLTAKDVRRSRRSLILSGLADVPVVVCFTLIGVLLWVYYQLPDHAMRRPESNFFVHYILHELPSGIRGVMAAGLFATAMGSLSTALNALATSFTRDFYVGLFRPRAGEHEQMSAARWSTAGFALLLALVGIGTAWVKLTHPQVRIIPIVLGSFGYTYGSLLGIFLVGMLTRTRGTCFGNLLAMGAGFAAVAVLSDLPNDIAALFGAKAYENPAWLPIVAFPWRILMGTIVTFLVALLFRTDKSVQERAVGPHKAP